MLDRYHDLLDGRKDAQLFFNRQPTHGSGHERGSCGVTGTPSAPCRSPTLRSDHEQDAGTGQRWRGKIAPEWRTLDLAIRSAGSCRVVESAAERAAELRQVGDWVLKRRLGSGAMGEVWLGWHRHSESRAAVKLFREHEALRGRARRFFDRERRAVARLRHPNIVGLYDVGPDFIAMAYIDGPNLAQRAASGLEPATALAITLQIADALAHAHDSGVVHRDVKPGNVLLDSQGNAYLGDFGLATLPDEDDPDAHARVGTPGYMAPEQIRDGAVGPAADQYALGRTLLEMLLGRLPPVDLERALSDLPADLPEALRVLLRRACASEPGQRFASVAELASALSDLDLGSCEAPARLAPEVRIRAQFGWATAPRKIERVSHDIARADYSVRSLAQAGVLAEAPAQRFLEESGYRDFGWSLYAHESRLGSVSDSGVLARASDLVVLAHGTLCTRAVWTHVAAAICRDNARAVVLTPDHLGSGDSRLEASAGALHLAPQAIVRTLQNWLDLLSVRDLPTVLVGHSAAAVALLSVPDEALGERTSRVAVTPVYPFAFRRVRLQLDVAALLLSTLGRIPAFKRLLGRLGMNGPETRGYTQAERDSMVAQFHQIPVRPMAALTRQVARAEPESADRLDRCTIVIGQDDPLTPAWRALSALDRIGFPKRSIHHIASGGHNPHMEREDHPEWTLRNVDDLARIVETMLVSAREGAPSSTVLESTVIADTAGREAV